MNLFERLKKQYRHVKKIKAQKKAWRYDFKMLSKYEFFLDNYKDELDAKKEFLEKEEYRLHKVEESHRIYEDVENYIPNGFLWINWFKKKIFKDLLVAIIFSKDRRLKILLKRPDGLTIKDGEYTYKINPKYMMRGRKYFIGLFFEDKLEQIEPSFIDKCPVSAKNFSKIFNDELISKVFSPKDKKDSPLKWILIIIIGLVALLLILHFSGVIDLKQIFMSFTQSGGTNSTVSNNGVMQS